MVDGFWNQEQSVEESRRCLILDLFYCLILHEGMYIDIYDYWIISQSWLIPEGESVAFLQDSYDLKAGPYSSPCFPKMVKLGPYRQILSNSVDMVTGWTEDN